MDLQVIPMINKSGEFISPPEPIEAYMLTDYQQVDYCNWGYYHTNGKKGSHKKGQIPEGTISQMCKGNDIVSNMYDTKLGKVCLRCITLIPKRLRLDKEDKKLPKE